MQLASRYGRCSGTRGQEIQFKILLLSLHPASVYLHSDKALCGQSNKMYIWRNATATLHHHMQRHNPGTERIFKHEKASVALASAEWKMWLRKTWILGLKTATVHPHAVTSLNKPTLIGVNICCYIKCVCSKQHKQDWRCTCDVTLRRVGATIVAVDVCSLR